MQYRILENNLTTKTQIINIEYCRLTRLGSQNWSKINTTDLIQNFPCQSASDEKKNILMSKYRLLSLNESDRTYFHVIALIFSFVVEENTSWKFLCWVCKERKLPFSKVF